MANFRRFRAGLAIALAAAAIAACGGKDSGEAPAGAGSAEGSGAKAGGGEVVKIVSSLPRTGASNAQTTAVVNGIRMAIDEYGGEVAGFRIAYEDWDDSTALRGTWDPQREAANADKAIRDPDVMVYIGTQNSGAAKVSMPMLNRAGIAMISPANTATGLTKPGMGEPNEPDVYRPSGKINFFRVVPADDIQGAVGADWSKELGVAKAFALHDKELYGRGIAEIFRKRCEEIGVEVVGFEGLDPKASNYKSLVVKIRESGAELVYFGGSTATGGGQLAKDLYSGGFEGKTMAPDGCFETVFIEAATPEHANERCHVTFGGVPADRLTGKGAEFYANYKKKYGIEPESYAVYGYEACGVALAAVARAGKKDREAIRLAVAATKDYEGALGTWSFDENGDTTLRTMSGNVVREGKFEFVKLLGE